jgi:S-DNA-T family DNA segregation ATPase FtsK/SpoIIIE
VVTADAGTTAGDLADALLRGGSGHEVTGTPTLRLQRADDAALRTLPSATTLVDAGLRAGSTITLTGEGAGYREPEGPVVARLSVLSGPDAGRTWDLAAGVVVIGRGPGSGVRLDDLMVSKTHARLLVGEVVEIVDAGSSNGLVVGDGRVPRLVLRPEDVVLVGGSEIQVHPVPSSVLPGIPAPTAPPSATVEFVRSPRVLGRYAERTLPAPEVPRPFTPQRLPFVALIGPVLMGAGMFTMTRNPMSLMFLALSPMLMLGSWWDSRTTGRRRSRAETAAFHEGLRRLRDQVEQAHQEEQQARRRETPATLDLVQHALGLDAGLWAARPDSRDFLHARLGTGDDVSRTTVEAPARGSADPELWDELHTVLAGLRDVTDVPLVLDLAVSGVIGVTGRPEPATAIARALVAQLVCGHSPAELVLVALTSRASAPRWHWLLWLPHVDSPHSPLTEHLGSDPAACARVLLGIEELIAARRADRTHGAAHLPRLLVLVEDDAPADRGRLVRVVEEGPAVGVHVLWCAPRPQRLPAASRCVLVVDDAGARVGSTTDGTWHDLVPERLDPAEAHRLARHLAGVRDAGAPVPDESDLPRGVGFLALAGHDLAEDPASVVARWHETGSVLDRTGTPVRRRTDAALRAVVGQGADGEFVLDLRAQGPHALVGGTTGSGKSEFLQAWVLGMAAAHSPDRVTFLFVDYKGGAAFADCVDLPHCVGLVTDLSPHVGGRALAALRAALRHREHLLAAAGAKDLLAMERAGDPRTPPALVIVVDEFAALVQEVPEFVDGVVDVAQRGRSLGLHLILATQRPAGVIKDNLRANTNLRIALRMADEHDSTDVLGSPMAAQFDPRVPGRGAVRTGPGRLAMFQTGYVGGRSDAAPAAPAVSIETLTFGPGEPWVLAPRPGPQAEHPDGPTDAARVVATLGAAARRAGVPAPRRPWLPELPTVLPLDLTSERDDATLALGMIDVPTEQAQVPFLHRPEQDGTLAVFGTTASGRSTVLRSVALSAATAQGHVEIYGLDLGGGALGMIAALPQVAAVVDGDDEERVARVITRLCATLDERADLFARVHAGSLSDHRRLTGTHLPRIYLLVDGIAALHDAYESPGRISTYTGLLRLVAEGRAVGVHVVLTAERPGALTTVMSAQVSRRLVLRQADANACAHLGAPPDHHGPDLPPGRGVLAGSTDEIQVAVLAGATESALQAVAVAEIADRLRAAGAPVAPPVGRLGSEIDPHDLPDQVDGRPVLGVAGDTLAPIGFERAGTLLVAGAGGSGRSTAVASIAAAIHRQDPAAPLYRCGPRRSPAARVDGWTEQAHTPAEIADLARRLAPLLAEPVDPEHPAITLVVEGYCDLPTTEAEAPMLVAVRAARRNGHLVVAESETTAWTSGWPLVAEIRAGRSGIVLQPDQQDGDVLFRVAFDRVRRADFPVGRGRYVTAGRSRTVQLPAPLDRGDTP